MSEVRGNQIFTATVTNSEPLVASELAEYLGLLDGTYRTIRWLSSLSHELTPIEDFVQSGIEMTEAVRDRMQRAVNGIWDSLPDGRREGVSESSAAVVKYSWAMMETQKEPNYGLSIAWIEMRSPLKLGFLNAAVAAVILAAIFSGGTIKCGSMSVQLPPLGQGIAALREALKPLSEGKITPPRLQDHIEAN